jgi:transcriptional regulator with XRE-family HTH domain
MAKNFNVLRERMSPEARARASEKARQYMAEMALDELREARALTQEHLAKLLGIRQAAVSKMERRADMYVSTLQAIIKAMGGKLQIVAIFPEGKVEIDQFRKLKRRGEAA